MPDTKVFGAGIAPAIQWTESPVYFASEGDTVHRLKLKNVSTVTATVYGVSFYGDSLSYRIINDELAYLPLDNARFPLFPGQSIWIDVLFTPDTANKNVRYASLAAKLDDGQSPPTVHMIGYIGKLGVTKVYDDLDIEIAPNPVGSSSFRLCTVSTFPPHATVTIVDPLGRTRMTLPLSGHSATIKLGDLENGIYFIRISDGNKLSTKLLRVDR